MGEQINLQDILSSAFDSCGPSACLRLAWNQSWNDGRMHVLHCLAPPVKSVLDHHVKTSAKALLLLLYLLINTLQAHLQKSERYSTKELR